MNAHADSATANAVRTHTTHRFPLLLRREYWEHKGGFLWAPLVAGAISLVLTLVFIIIAHVMAGRLGDSAGNGQISLDNGQSMSINGLDLGALTSKLGPDEMAQLADGIDLSLLLSG
ncbi:MAG TPA: hypothetical protein VLK29_09850, partial [Luteimonas sp.]|nr:hypothetical protein [Luteimonas sp.]